MDHTIKPENIAAVLRDFDRKKEHESIVESSNTSLEVVSAIGTETSLTVLIDIRRLMSELLIATKESTTELQLQRQIDEQRHKETLGYLEQISDRIQSVGGRSVSQLVVRPGSSTTGSTNISSGVSFYYRGDEIKTVQSVIGCILLHLDNMISRTLLSDIGEMDTTVMELRDWTAVVRILKDADSSTTAHTGVLKLPKFDATETKHAINIIASPTSGRTTVCKTEHITDMLKSCSGIMGCVDEIRNRALQCPGILSPNRYYRLASISFPYVTNENTLNLQHTTEVQSAGSKVVLDRVKQMVEQQKKIYVNEILKNNSKPLTAANTALSTSKKT